MLKKINHKNQKKIIYTREALTINPMTILDDDTKYFKSKSQLSNKLSLLALCIVYFHLSLVPMDLLFLII